MKILLILVLLSLASQMDVAEQMSITEESLQKLCLEFLDSDKI